MRDYSGSRADSEPVSPAPRPVRERPATREKRAATLKVAVEIFGSKGYVNGTLADIAEQVGMTHAGVLHHFGSKQKRLEVQGHFDTGI